MKKNFFLLFSMLALSTSVLAATDFTNFCGGGLVSGSSKPTMTWETNFVGDIIITLSDGEGATNTVFRSGGMADGVKDFYIADAANNSASSTEAKNYFYQEMSGNTFVLRRKSRSAADEAALAGKYIKFYEKHVQWWCTENTNAAYQVNCFFAYDKSVTCGASLDRPTISSIASDGTVSFVAIDGATSYVARVYHDLDFLYEQTIVNGGKLTYKPYIPESTDYEVTIQALGEAGAKSRESLAATWTTTGDLTNLPVSGYCGDFVFQQPNNDASRARLKIETKKGSADGVKDTLVFTILKYAESEANNPYWRSNGLNQNGLRYDGATFTDYFQLVGNPSGQQEIRYVKKDAATVAFGKKITYNINVNLQSAEWATTGNTNAAANSWTIDYIYGTTCTLALDEEADNTAVIAANDGRTLDARLERSFESGDNFYSLCLPFGLNAAQLREVFGDDYVLGEMQDASNANGVVTFEMGTESSFEAGKPYIIRPTADAENPLFRGVTIDADASTSVSFGGIAGMRGFYAPSVAGEDEWFLGAANTLYQNSDNSASKAFRAFFQVLGGSPLNAPRIRMLPQTATGMETVQNGPAQEVRKVLRDGEVYILRNGAAYTVFGQRVY